MKTNEELQRDVQRAIQCEPLLNLAEIGVTVKNGIVTLTGTVDSYAKKYEAEEAAKSVVGVKAVVEKIEISFESNVKKTDSEIAAGVIAALKLNWIPDENIKIEVEDGWITLEGELPWSFQKEIAKKSLRNLAGVMGVSNDIVIKWEPA